MTDTILVVDDDLGIQKQLKWSLTDYNVVFADDHTSAIAQLRRFEPKVVTLDLGLPPDPANASEGLRILHDIIALAPRTKVIVVTGNNDKQHALKAIDFGAYDFYQKPIDSDTIKLLVHRALNLSKLEHENSILARTRSGMSRIVGNSEAIQKVVRRAEKIANTDISTLLLGESGTGKELIARAIHMNSPRRFFPMVTVHCGAIAENLMESELFGHERGAFTGAQYARKGKFEMADGATLFLDEISTISMKMQIELLRVLETKRFTRVGGNRELTSDFRIICATNRDLKAMVDAGEFREDLFYRLNVFSIEVPPLRERVEDIKLLTEHFIKLYAEQMNKATKRIGKRALKLLENYSFPGNVRELENLVERAIVIGAGDTIRLEDLPLDSSRTEPSWESISEVEHHHIRRILEKYDWNISQSAKALGVDRVTLYSKIKKYKINKGK